jgi:uncharacterized protein (DUF1501 family)
MTNILLDNTNISLPRRRILAGSAAWLAGGMSGAGSFALNMQSIAAAATPVDYKALVCIFLFGGNDSGNTVIPYDTAEYNKYLIAREGSVNRPYGITRLRSDLLPLAASNITDGRSFALPPEMSAFKGLYDAGKAAIVGNVGLLMQSTTRAQYESGSIALPPQLLSHSDQATFWQSGVPSYTTASGWGGRIADLIASANAGGRVSTAISVAGNNLWQVGNSVIPYPVDAVDGAVELFNMDNKGYGSAMRAMLAANRSNLLEQEVARVYNRSIGGEQAITAAMAATKDIDAAFPPETPAGVPGPGAGWHGDLMNKLAMVARMISARDILGMKRQVFYVSIGGFDMHNTLEYHRYALKAISDAMTTFYKTTERLGVERNVTTFTASDFGRPLQVNGTGSDHGWGAHHLVVGGDVVGGNIYGRMPTMDTRSQDYTNNQGTLIPTTSVDQYAATMARWMGVSASDMPTVLPNIGRFATSNLGFMRV